MGRGPAIINNNITTCQALHCGSYILTYTLQPLKVDNIVISTSEMRKLGTTVTSLKVTRGTTGVHAQAAWLLSLRTAPPDLASPQVRPLGTCLPGSEEPVLSASAPAVSSAWSALPVPGQKNITSSRKPFQLSSALAQHSPTAL